MSTGKWFHNVELEFCGGKIDKDELDTDRFTYFLLKKMSQDKIPVYIDDKTSQFNPPDCPVSLQIDIFEEGEEFDVYIIDFFKDVNEAKDFVAKHRLNYKTNKEAKYMYRCRMCGDVFTSIYSGTDRAYENLVDAIYKISVNNQPPIAMITAHQCKLTKGGIADLIGYEIE